MSDLPKNSSIEIPDPVVLKDLAFALGQRPFRVVADVVEFGQLKFTGDLVDFVLAAKVAKKYGFDAKRTA